MSEPRVRRIDARPATPDVEEYRELVKLAESPLPENPDQAARELVRLCRLRTRSAILRSNLRFGRGLSLIRVADLDGDGRTEMLAIDTDHTVHTPRLLTPSDDQSAPVTWLIGAHRYRGRLLGVSFSSFGVFNRQEAIVTSVEEHEGGPVYRELKLTCDGQQWDVSELEHRRNGGPSGRFGGAFGEIRLIGDSSEPGRVPVLRGRPEDGRLWVEILDDREAREPRQRTASENGDFSKVSFLPDEVADLVLCEDELVVAYSRGGIQRIGRDGRLRSLLFPQWRFVCLAYAPARRLGAQGSGSGLLLGGTSFGYVFAMDTAQSGVLWRMDAGFLFSAMTLADVESTGRIDLVLGGIDGGLRTYELTDTGLLDKRCRQLYTALGPAVQERLLALAPPGHDAHAAVQLYLLSRVLESTGPASLAVVELVRWFTSGQPGWHMLPERAQRDAVVMLEHFLLLHLPQLARDEARATPTGPLPLLTLKQLQSAPLLPADPESGQPVDPSTKIQLARTVLAELVEIYLGAPRLVRHQIDRISRRLFEQYWQLAPQLAELPGSDGRPLLTSADQPPPELRKLLTVRSLRARDYAHALGTEAEARLRHIQSLPETHRPEARTFGSSHEHNEVVLRVLRAVGLLEELRTDRFSMELERLDLSATAIDPLVIDEPTGEARLSGVGAWPRRCFIAGIGRLGSLRVEPLEPSSQSSPGDGSRSTALGTRRESKRDSGVIEWPWLAMYRGPAVHVPGTVRFLEVRRLWREGDRVRPAIIVGIEEAGDTRLSVYTLEPERSLPALGVPGGSADGAPRPGEVPVSVVLRGEIRCGSAGVEPIGYDLHLRDDDTASAQLGGGGERAEVLLLRAVGALDRNRSTVLALDAPGGTLRLRAHAVPGELIAVASNARGSLHVSAARVTVRPASGPALSVPAPASASCCALNDAANIAAIGTSTGHVQIFAADSDALRLVSQHLLAKGISAMCFVPEGVCGMPCLAIGTEDEQVHIVAVDHRPDGRADGQVLIQLAVGGTPQRMLCRPIAESDGGGYRLMILLQGGVLASWEAHPADGHLQSIERLLDLGAQAAGSRSTVLRAALRGQGPHIRAVAIRDLLRSAREGRIAGSILMSGAGPGSAQTSGERAVVPGRTSVPPVIKDRPSGASPAAAPAPIPVATTGTGGSSSHKTTERGTPAVASVLYLCRMMLQSDPGIVAEPASRTPTRPGSEEFDVSAWPLPRPPRHRVLIIQLFEALMPIALGGIGSGADAQQSKLARDLLGRLVQFCDEPLSIRSELLQTVERFVRPEHIEELTSWLPLLILYDSRSAAWPFAIDSVAALFLRHLQRLDRAKLFDQAEPVFFRNIVAVLEAVAPTQPSRFLLTNMALLLRSALSWERAFLAGDLGRVRLHLPHAVLEAMCQPEILPDPEVRAFLAGVSRRWGPRLPTLGAEDNDDALAGGAGSLDGVPGELYWWFEVAVENGFDQMYYERLADELTRYALPVTPDGMTPDSWALAEMVQGVLRLFDMTSLTELQASLQPQVVDKALSAIRAQRALIEQHLSYRYRDEAWAFFDETIYLSEQQFLAHALQEVDRKTNKAQIAHSLDELAAQLDARRNQLRLRLLDRLTSGAPLGHVGAFVSRMLAVRPSATVVALMTVWWQVLVEEATRLRTEPDFEVRLVSDLGVSESKRVLRYAVILASDAARTAHSVTLAVRACEPKEVRARVLDVDPVDLEPGHELGLIVECPTAIAETGLRYRIEIELSHDGDKRTERVIEGQFRRESRQTARSLLDSFAERLPTLYGIRRDQLEDLLKPANASVALVTAFPAHAYELLGELMGLDWPERPVDTLEHWRMVNVAARSPSTGPAPQSAPRTVNPTLRDLIQQMGARIGSALGLPNGERLDTPDLLVRALSEAPQPSHGAAARGLIILGLPELAEKARLDESEQRQILSLGARLCLAYRGRCLLVLSPQAAALSLVLPLLPPPSGTQPHIPLPLESGPRHLELLDLDHVADPYSVHRNDEKMRAELELSLGNLLVARESAVVSGGPAQTGHGPSSVPAVTQTAVRALIDATGTDLRLIAECLPVVEQALRERTRAPLSPSAFETRVGTYMNAVWTALPLAHRLYLAALCSDAVDLEVGDLRPGMVVDTPVYSISGKDRLPTSKVIAQSGVRLEQRTIDDLAKVMWLKKIRVRGSFQDSRTVLWTYLRQPRPRLRGRSATDDPTANKDGSRWLEPTAIDLRRLGLLRVLRLGGDRSFFAFTSSAVREWLRALLGLVDGEAGLPNTIDGRNLVRQLPLWDAAAVDRALGGNSSHLRAVLGWNRPGVQGSQTRWNEFLDLSRACRKWMDGQDEHRFMESVGRYFRLDLVDGTAVDDIGHAGASVPMRSVQVRFREKRQLPWLKRVVMYLPGQQPDRPMLEQVQIDLRARLPTLGSGGSGPHLLPRPDAAYSGADGTISDTALSAIVVVPELSADVVGWSRNLFHVAAIDIADLQHAALHDNPVEELIRRLAAAASYAALSPFRSKMGLANQELIEEMFYGRRALLEEIRGQRQENFLIVGPRKIGKTSLLQRVRFELEQQGYRVIPRGMDYTTAPSSRELLRAMILELLEDIDPVRAAQGFALGEALPPLRSIVDAWTRRFPERSIAVVLDEIDTILRTERRAYLLGEWREAWTLGQALATLLPVSVQPSMLARHLPAIRQTLQQAGFPADVIQGVLEGLQTPADQRRQSPLLEELRSASALLLQGGAVCRIILAGHAELVEARWDLFGPLLNFAKLRMLGPLDEGSAERMVREPFARLGLRFENASAEMLLLEKTFRVPAWIQHCGALIIQSIDERLRSSRREEQKITERDVLLALEKVHAEERAALQSENGLYMLGPECSFVLLSLVEEPWFTVDSAVDYLHVFFQTLEPKDRRKIVASDDDFMSAFSAESVRRIIRDLTNTFYLISDEAEYLTTEGRVSQSSPFILPISAAVLDGRAPPPGSSAGAPSPLGTGPNSGPNFQHRDRLRRSYKVSRSMVSTVFQDELTLPKKLELARRAMRLWQDKRGVWARTAERGQP